MDPRKGDERNVFLRLQRILAPVHEEIHTRVSRASPHCISSSPSGSHHFASNTLKLIFAQGHTCTYSPCISNPFIMNRLGPVLYIFPSTTVPRENITLASFRRLEDFISLDHRLKSPSALRERRRMQVGRYEILEIIGSGAHGRVARAHDPLISRLVAIKLFPKELAHGEARQHFIQEARVVGQLSHPAIITLHDMGIDEASHTPYLVMEYLEGQPLDRILDKHSVPFQKACGWAGQVASALAVAHKKGVIHGDVKPANMLITGDGH